MILQGTLLKMESGELIQAEFLYQILSTHLPVHQAIHRLKTENKPMTVFEVSIHQGVVTFKYPEGFTTYPMELLLEQFNGITKMDIAQPVPSG